MKLSFYFRYFWLYQMTTRAKIDRVFRTRAEMMLSLVRPPSDSADELSDDDNDYDEYKFPDFCSDLSSEPPDVSHLEDLMREIEEDEIAEYNKYISQNDIIPTPRAVPIENDAMLVPQSDTVLTDLVSLGSYTFSSEYPCTEPDTSQNFAAPTTSAVSFSELPLYDFIDPVAGTSSDLSTQNFVSSITRAVASSGPPIHDSVEVPLVKTASSDSSTQNTTLLVVASPILPPVSTNSQNITTNSTTQSKRVYRRKAEPILTPPALQPVPTKKKIPPPVVNWNWRKTLFRFSVDLPTDDFMSGFNILRSPGEYFGDLFSDDIFTLMVEQTNLYSVQKTTVSINTTVQEMKTFIGFELIMGIVHMPAYTDYWSNELRFPLISEKMSLKRYQQLRRYIHFADNSTDDGTDPYFKIRPIFEELRKNFSKIPNEKRMSVDEMMVPYKGKKAGFRKQYLPKKPKKWGFKIFVRAGVSGIVYDYILYGGQWTFENSGNRIVFPAHEAHFGFGAQIVLALSQTIQDKATSVLFFDNFFTSPLLIKHLRKEYGILSLGTLRENRCKTDMKPDKVLMKKRGNIDYRSDNRNRLVIVKWADTKVVTLLSSYVGHRPIERKERYDKKKKVRVKVKCPQIVKHYNDHMGGVDLADMLVALYRTQFRTHRYYLAIFSQILDVAVNNAWLIYRRDFLSVRANSKEKPMTLKMFRIQIAESLSRKNKRGRPSATTPTTQKKIIRKPRAVRPANDVRLDRYDHFPQYTQKKNRCKYCTKGITKVSCTKCNLSFCFTTTSNCFLDAHTKK